MVKTPSMRVIELEHGEPLETLLPRLFDELGTMQAVADHLGLHRITLIGWLGDLGAEVRKHQTRVRFPEQPVTVL